MKALSAALVPSFSAKTAVACRGRSTCAKARAVRWVVGDLLEIPLLGSSALLGKQSWFFDE